MFNFDAYWLIPGENEPNLASCDKLTWSELTNLDTSPYRYRKWNSAKRPCLYEFIPNIYPPWIEIEIVSFSDDSLLKEALDWFKFWRLKHEIKTSLWMTKNVPKSI